MPSPSSTPSTRTATRTPPCARLTLTPRPPALRAASPRPAPPRPAPPLPPSAPASSHARPRRTYGAQLIMQLLRDNLTLWIEEGEAGKEDEENR